jgi:spermidine/putrescine transport system substrate-binding protein
MKYIQKIKHERLIRTHMKKILSLLVAVLFVFALASCDSRTTLKVFIWGEYIDMDLVELFEETYGVRVDVIIFESNEAAVLQVKSSSFDIIVPSDYAIEELANGGYLQEIDWSRLENISKTDFSTQYLQLLNQIEDFAVEGAKILDFAVPYFWGNIGIIYNKDVVSQEAVELAGWDILKRQDLRVMFYDIGRDATMIALRALYGQSINPNLATDAQLAAAEQWLTDAKGPRTRYLTTEIYDVFTSPATIDVAHAFSGEAIYLLPENDKLGYHVPDSGTNVWMDMLAIPKNARQTDLAYKFIDFFMSYENALTNSITVGYTSPRADVAQSIVDEEIYGPEYQVVVRPYDQIHRYKPELKAKIELLWSRIRGQ